MKKFLAQAVALLVLTAVALTLYFQNTDLTDLPFVPQKTVVKKLTVNNYTLLVEIVDNQAKRAKGLGGRQSLATGAGMLFIFPDEGKHPFWMKDLKFALDFIWIKGDQVIDVTENIPPPAPTQKDASLPIYESKENIDKVLEVNSGTVQRLGIKAGDIVKLE